MRLWIRPEGLRALRAATAPGGPLAPVGDAVRAAAARLATRPLAPTGPREDWRQGAELWSLAWLLGGDPAYPKRVAEAVDVLTREPFGSDLGKAADAQWAAVGFDLCRQAWSTAQQRLLGSRLRQLAESFATVSDGNPDNPFNNWWGVSHSGAGLAALAVADLYPEARAIFEREAEKVASYLRNYGERGHYYEGTGYGFYAMSHWAPFLLAARFVGGLDLTALNPGLTHWGATSYALTVAAPKRWDSVEEAGERAPELGMRASWNDDGGQFVGAGVGALLFPLAPPAQVPALRWLYDRLCGPLGDRTWTDPQRHPLWILLFYPWEIPAAHPEGRLPRLVNDEKTGLVAFRNRWRDGDDAVAALYAQSYHPGGHHHQDAGSLRLFALGAGWSQAGGQAKLGPEYQSVPLWNGGQAPRAKGIARLGRVSYVAPQAEGGHASLRLDRVYGATWADRHLAVDFSGRAGAPVACALFDNLQQPEAGEWTWTMCFERHLRFEARPEANGFALHDDAGGAWLLASFGQPANLRFEEWESPASARTFSNGQHRTYPGARVARATVPAADFFAVLTVQRGPAPAVTFAGEGLRQGAAVGALRASLALSRWWRGPLRWEPAD